MSLDRIHAATTRPRTLVALFAVALIAVACGSGSSDDADAAGGLSTTAAGPSTTSDATTEPDVQSIVDTEAETQASADGPDSAYCLLSAAIERETDALSDLNLPAEEFNQRSAEVALASLDQMVATAPAGLPVDVDAFAGLFREYAATSELAGWNVDNFDEAGNELLSGLFDLSLELAVYDGEVCGVGDFADSDTDEYNTTEAAPVETPPVETPPVETPTDETPPTDLGEALTAEEIDLILADPTERAFHLGIWTEIGLTEEQAECVTRGVLALPEASDDAVDAVLVSCGA